MLSREGAERAGDVVPAPRGRLLVIAASRCGSERQAAPHGRSAGQNPSHVELRGSDNDRQQTRSTYCAKIALIGRRIPASRRAKSPLVEPKTRANRCDSVLQGKSRIGRCISRRVSASVGFWASVVRRGFVGFCGGWVFNSGRRAWFVCRVWVGGASWSLSGCFRFGLVSWACLCLVRGAGVRVASGSVVWSLSGICFSWGLVFGGSAGFCTRGPFAGLVVWFWWLGGGFGLWLSGAVVSCWGVLGRGCVGGLRRWRVVCLGVVCALKGVGAREGRRGGYAGFGRTARRRRRAPGGRRSPMVGREAGGTGGSRVSERRGSDGA